MGTKKVIALDVVKLIACVMKVESHCLPLFENPGANFYYGQWFFRFCVPLFFISTGYFWAKMDDTRRKGHIKRIMMLYVLSSIIYLSAYIKGSAAKRIISNLLFGYHHLWYLSPLAIGLVCILGRKGFTG